MLLKPPIFRNAAASQKINEPASNRPIRLAQFQSHVTNPASQMFLIHPDRHPAGQTATGTDLLRNFGKQSGVGTRIRIHKNQPVAGGRRRAAIPGAGDLIDRLEHNGCARRARDFGRAVGGIVVAHNQFKVPAALRERIGR